MKAGKTTTAASLMPGLTRAGLPAGAAKVSGTGASAQFSASGDAGAHAVLDFTDAGHGFTNKVGLTGLHGVQEILVAHRLRAGCTAFVREVAGIIGLNSRSPLACQEVSAATDGPVHGFDDLADPGVAAGLGYHSAKERSGAAPSNTAFDGPAQQGLAA